MGVFKIFKAFGYAIAIAFLWYVGIRMYNKTLSKNNQDRKF